MCVHVLNIYIMNVFVLLCLLQIRDSAEEVCSLHDKLETIVAEVLNCTQKFIVVQILQRLPWKHSRS